MFQLHFYVVKATVEKALRIQAMVISAFCQIRLLASMLTFELYAGQAEAKQE